jgi:hypothetical protein
MSPMAQFAAVFVTLLLLLYGFRAANKEAPAAPPVEE